MRKIRHVDRLPEHDAAGNPVAHPPVIHWANQVADKIDEIIDRVNALSDNISDVARDATREARRSRRMYDAGHRR